MNFSLSENIARMQRMNCISGEIVEATDEDIVQVTGLVQRIEGFKLGKKPDKHGNRTGWFESKDPKALVDGLRPSDDQKKFLGQVMLKLRVMTAVEESTKARAINLLCYKPGEPQQFLGHLFGALALSSADTPDGIPVVYSNDSYAGPLLPGMPEFDDLQLIVENFS